MSSLAIEAMAHEVPRRVVTNDEMSTIVDTSDEWITGRTGIRRRHFAEEATNVEMAAAAAMAAIEKSGLDAGDIAFCIVATFTPDTYAPSTACGVAEAIGLSGDVLCFDINGACAGFLYGLQVVEGLLGMRPDRHALLIGSEKVSSVVDFSDRSTCVLFGDAAAAAVISLREDASVPDCFVSGTSPNTKVITCATHPGPGQKDKISMEGREVFRFAVEAIENAVLALFEQTGLDFESVGHIVCHQANKRIIDHVIKKMGAPREKFFVNLEEFGNTSAASIPLALSQMDEQGLLCRGERVVCVGFGAGLVWGGVVLTW